MRIFSIPKPKAKPKDTEASEGGSDRKIHKFGSSARAKRRCQ